MRSILVSALVLVVLFLLLSCNESYDYSQASLGLGLKDYSCTEAWIEVQIGSNDKTANIYIKKNGVIIQTVNVGQSSTLYYFDSLLPNTNYTFDAVTYEDGKEVKSNPVTFTTLDTTSHNFTWQTFSFGEHSSSVLYDAAIIDGNNIWAVGEIYMNDSLGNPDPTPYNAVHWDGSSWEVKRIPTRTLSGTIVSSAIKTIFAFNGNDIWTFSISGSYSNWNGNIWETEFVNERDGSGNKYWGINSSNLFLVCNNGGISFYNGTNWQKIGNGTNVDLLAISGTTDGKAIWACGYTDDYANSVLIRMKDGVAEKMYEGSSNGQSNGYYVGPMSGVWTDSDYRVFLMNGSGIYIQENSSDFFLDKEIARFSHGSYGIDGTRSNSIFACGDEFVGHWNGSTYVEYPELSRRFRTFYNISTKDNIVCAVGYDYNGAINSQAIIVIGKRN
jgi:hypothetical protein